MQASRFEQKYIVSEETALQIRQFVQGLMELDENGLDQPDNSYPVHSLYLDSDDLKLYWATINGDKNRYKLRLRFYNDNPDTPVFFEIKRRMNNCIMKQRGGVRRAAVPMLLAGQLPDPAYLVAHEARQLLALQRFCQLQQELHAGPKLHVAYAREAYVPADDNSARITMDRHVRVQAQATPDLSTQMSQPAYVWPHQVVLELKFTNRFPDWFGELVRRFGLRPRGAAKYVDGVELLEGDFGLRPSHRRRHGDSSYVRADSPDDDPTLLTRLHHP
jgi:hypothetical protein